MKSLALAKQTSMPAVEIAATFRDSPKWKPHFRGTEKRPLALQTPLIPTSPALWRIQGLAQKP
jgi:hypothetical protein